MKEAVNVRAVLRECAVDLLAAETKVSAEHVVRCAYRRHGDLFAEATERMVLEHARRIAADIMRSFSEDDGGDQLTIPGLGLPTAICVASPDGTYFVRTDKATWPEIEAGERQREQNVEAAQAKLDAYREGKETVRPYMEHDHCVSVADAIETMRRG